MKRALLSVLLLATPVAAAAGAMGVGIPLAKPESAAPGAVKIDMSGISGGEYRADPNHTLVGFRISHMGFNDYLGIFGDVAGTLDLDIKDLEQSTVAVTMPLSGLTTASADLTKHLRTPDFFAAEDNPAVSFRSTEVTRTGPTTADITGDLTIRDTTKPVTLHAEFTGAGIAPMSEKETVGFEATAMVSRSDFGVDFAPGIVGDEVALDITAAFQK